jgi:AcrR family transcriptional regulator
VRLRDQQKDMVRSALIRAGMELFESQGFAKTTVDQITSAAGVAKGTFYNYFETKEDLLVAGMTAMLEQENGMAEARILEPASVRERLDRLIRWSAKWFEDHPELSLIWSLERLRRGIEDRSPNGFDGHLRAIIVSGQKSGELRNDRPAELLLTEMTALFVFALACWIHGGRRYDLATAVRTSIDTYITGAKGTEWEGKTDEFL